LSIEKPKKNLTPIAARGHADRHEGPCMINLTLLCEGGLSYQPSAVSFQPDKTGVSWLIADS
jgi:hypothetical protein